MEINYNIVQLVNGLSLVGDIEFTPDSIVIKFPLEITAKPVTDDNGKIIGEHMVLRPYLVMTDDREVVIDQFNIICFKDSFYCFLMNFIGLSTVSFFQYCIYHIIVF